LRFGVLGPLCAWHGERSLSLGTPQQQAVLAALLLRTRQAMSRDQLVEAVWGAGVPPSAVGVVQSYVARLRRVLEPDRPVRASPQVLVASGDGYVLRVEACQVDLGTFEERRAAARAARAAGDLGAAAARLAQAMELWWGTALAGIPGPFAQIQRDRLTELRLATLETRLELDLEIGRHSEVVGELAALVAENPLREGLRGQLMMALARSGRQAEALAAYDECRHRLADELGIDPGAQLQKLHRAILINAPEIAPPRQPAFTTMRRQTPPGPAQLPPDVADFTGREDHVASARALLERGAGPDDVQAVAVVAIAGKTGVGKTALAVHVAHRLRSCLSDGQLFVDLRGAGAEPADATDVLGQFLRALGVDGSAIPDAAEKRVELYRSTVADKRLLIVLDNAASDAQVRPLVPGTPSCAVLVTSRRRLGALVGASTIDLDVFTAEEALHLLAPIVGPQRLSAEPLAAREIARLCGYLPLALRIAGARLAAYRHWPLARLADHMSDEERRLDELIVSDFDVRASVLVSYRALAVDERRAFRLLSLLDVPSVPGWVIAALLDVPLDHAEGVADALAAGHLLEVASPGAAPASRYRFHDLVRLVARERAAQEESDAARRAAVERALAAWLWRADAVAGTLPGHALGTIRGPTRRYPVGGLAGVPTSGALAWFHGEQEALAAAVRQAADYGWAGLAWELAAALTDYFVLEAHYDEWRNSHERALQACRQAGDRRGAAVMLRGLAELATMTAEFGACMRYADGALPIFRELGERQGEVDTLVQCATAHYEQGRHDEQEECAELALACARQTGYPLGEAMALHNLGLLWIVHRDLDKAATYCARFRDLARETGDRHQHAMALMTLAVVHRDQGRLDEAAAGVTAALAEFRQIGHKISEAWAIANLANILVRQRDPGARAAAGRAHLLFTELHVPDGQAYAQRVLGMLDLDEGLFDQAIHRLRDAARFERIAGGKFNLARVLRELGRAYVAVGDPAAARAAWTEARDLFAALANPQAAEVAAMLNAAEHPADGTQRCASTSRSGAVGGLGRR